MKTEIIIKAKRGMRSMKILVISGTILGSKTLILAKKIFEDIKQLNPSAEVQLLDLKQFKTELCDGRMPEDYNDDTQRVIKMMTSADIYLIASPIFHGSIPGVLKNIFDLVPANVFEYKIFGVIANGGNDKHYLVIENQLKPIISYFKSYVAVHSVFAHNGHFNQNNELIDIDVKGNLKKLANEVLALHQKFNLKVETKR